MIVKYILVDKTCPYWVSDGGYIYNSQSPNLVGFTASIPSVKPGYVARLYAPGLRTYAWTVAQQDSWTNPDGTPMTQEQVIEMVNTLIEEHDV